MKAVFLPPKRYHSLFFFLRKGWFEGIEFFCICSFIDLLYQKGDDPLLVFLSPGDDLWIQTTWMALHPLRYFASRGNRSRLLFVEQGEEMNHLFGKVRMDRCSFLLQVRTKKRDWLRYYFIGSICKGCLVENYVVIQAHMSKSCFTELVEVFLPLEVRPSF